MRLPRDVQAHIQEAEEVKEDAALQHKRAAAKKCQSDHRKSSRLKLQKETGLRNIKGEPFRVPLEENTYPVQRMRELAWRRSSAPLVMGHETDEYVSSDYIDCHQTQVSDVEYQPGCLLMKLQTNFRWCGSCRIRGFVSANQGASCPRAASGRQTLTATGKDESVMNVVKVYTMGSCQSIRSLTPCGWRTHLDTLKWTDQRHRWRFPDQFKPQYAMGCPCDMAKCGSMD